MLVTLVEQFTAFGVLLSEATIFIIYSVVIL
jgi:hypothetical protein